MGGRGGEGRGTRWLIPVPSPPLGRGCLHSSLWQNLPNWSMRYGGCWLEGRAQPLRLERGEGGRQLNTPTAATRRTRGTLVIWSRRAA